MSYRHTPDPVGRAELRRRGERVVARVTRDVELDMHRLVPIDTGALDATIEGETDGLVGRVYFGNPDAGVDYHLYQEFGTRRMQAQPYARPALYQHRSVTV